MRARLLRGRTLSFKSRPAARNDHASYVYEEDGALLVENGRITAAGNYNQILEKMLEVVQFQTHFAYHIKR